MQDSSSIENDNQIATASPHQPWDITGKIPEKSPQWDYGYVLNGHAVGSTRDGLIVLVGDRGGAVSFVWTPETPEPVLPERVPFLVDAFRHHEALDTRGSMFISGVFLLLGVLAAIGLHKWDALFRNYFVVIGAVGLLEGIWRYARSRHYSLEDAASNASTARFTAWLKTKSLGGYSVSLAGCIVVVGMVQGLSPESIALAALVKPAVRNGEFWRLFTSTLMHASMMHFWMNFVVLLHFSRIIENTLQRAFLPLVFLITSAIGSVFSVLLYPNATSVGASGGLMGLLGFITIAAAFDRSKYPFKYFKQMIGSIALIAAFGAFGFAFIDNAAHFGGLAGGLLLGLLFLRKTEQPSTMREKFIHFAGTASIAALFAVAAFAAYRMVG